MTYTDSHYYRESKAYRTIRDYAINITDECCKATGQPLGLSKGVELAMKAITKEGLIAMPPNPELTIRRRWNYAAQRFEGEMVEPLTHLSIRMLNGIADSYYMTTLSRADADTRAKLEKWAKAKPEQERLFA